LGSLLHEEKNCPIACYSARGVLKTLILWSKHLSPELSGWRPRCFGSIRRPNRPSSPLYVGTAACALGISIQKAAKGLCSLRIVINDKESSLLFLMMSLFCFLKCSAFWFVTLTALLRYSKAVVDSCVDQLQGLSCCHWCQ
jgi:hypothetical protein